MSTDTESSKSPPLVCCEPHGTQAIHDVKKSPPKKCLHGTPNHFNENTLSRIRQVAKHNATQVAAAEQRIANTIQQHSPKLGTRLPQNCKICHHAPMPEPPWNASPCKKRLAGGFRTSLNLRTRPPSVPDATWPGSSSSSSSTAAAQQQHSSSTAAAQQQRGQRQQR